MNSSGIKRGLAATAISALAVTGLPFLATSASATPLTADPALVDANDVILYAPDVAVISTKNDGTNTSVSLLAGGGSNVTQISFEYDLSTSVGDVWVEVPGGPVARNADGAFKLDWDAPPAAVEDVRAIANTGQSDSQAVTVDNTAETVELGTEGALGVFQEPYTEGTYSATTSELLAVSGTTSGAAAPAVEARSHIAGGTDSQNTAVDADTNPATPQTFHAILDIDGYPYSGGSEPNQLVVGAEAAATDDAEASTLYVQQITTITATPSTVDLQGPADTESVTLTVTDQNGKPVAGAQVGGGADTDTDGAGPDSDTDGGEGILGYTNGAGKFTATNDVDGPGNHVYFANTTNTDAYEPGTDPATTVTATEYTPVLSTVDIVNERSHSNFDTDELEDDDDFTIETRDQRGNLIDEAGAATPEYRWVIDPSGTGDTVTTAWRLSTDIAPAGTYEVDGPEQADYPGGLPDGTYTLEARRPNVSGTGLTNATPEVVQVSESEITFADGDDANAPIEGSYTVEGRLANDAGGLGGREVTITYGGAREDSRLAPQAEQPAGVTRLSDTSATVVVDAEGNFAIKLVDPAGPVVVPDNPEDATLSAVATGEDVNDATNFQNGAYGKNDAVLPAEDAADSVVIHWQAVPAVAAIEVTTENLAGAAAPGRPVGLDIIVRGEDGVNDGNTGNNPPLDDFAVDISVDKGFLSPDAENKQDLNLADDHDTVGDLWGFFQNDGTSETVSTGDAGEAGAVAAMERDADFDDDGLSTMTITVKAGDKTVTKTVTFDATNVLNLVEGDLDPAEGEPAGQVPTDQEVDFQLYVYDQFENLVGNRYAAVTDDSTVADFRTDGDFGETRTDFTVSGPGITAFSDAPTTQTLTARVMGNESLVAANENQASDAVETLPVDSDPIEWVEPTVEQVPAALALKGGDNGAADDSLFANAIRETEGATVKLFRKRADGSWKLIRKGVMNAKGNFRFKNVNDKNGNKVTRYKAVVKATEDTLRGVGKKKVR